VLYGTTDPSCRLLGAEVGVGVRCLCGGGGYDGGSLLVGWVAVGGEGYRV